MNPSVYNMFPDIVMNRVPGVQSKRAIGFIFSNVNETLTKRLIVNSQGDEEWIKIKPCCKSLYMREMFQPHSGGDTVTCPVCKMKSPEIVMAWIEQ